MENHQVVELIHRELPGLLQRDPALQEWVLELTRTQYADKAETESRFDQLLEQLRRNQEAQDRKWTENQEAQERKWEENQEQLRRTQDSIEAQDRKWTKNQEAQERKWEQYQEAQDQKWEENHKILLRMQDSIETQAKKHDSSIGALGARWGLNSEQSFRRGLEGILSDSFGVEVRNVTEWDKAGEVFGHSDQVELDVVIQNGVLILVEIKSSMSKSDLYTFDRKAAFYAKHHDRPVGRKLVISPMVEKGAQQVAVRLGIEVYSHAEEASLEG